MTHKYMHDAYRGLQEGPHSLELLGLLILFGWDVDIRLYTWGGTKTPLQSSVVHLWDLWKAPRKWKFSVIPQWRPQFMQSLYHRYKDRTVFPLHPAPKQFSALTRQVCSSRGYCFKYNYLKTSAWCYRTFVLLSCWTSTQEKNTLYYWSYLQLLYSREWGCTVFWSSLKFCIIPHNKPHRKRIDEWFSIYLKASEHRLCVEPNEPCGLVLWLKIFGPEPHANIYLGTGSSLQFLL